MIIPLGAKKKLSGPPVKEFKPKHLAGTNNTESFEQYQLYIYKLLIQHLSTRISVTPHGTRLVDLINPTQRSDWLRYYV